jgi:hypothetical protein
MESIVNIAFLFGSLITVINVLFTYLCKKSTKVIECRPKRMASFSYMLMDFEVNFPNVHCHFVCGEKNQFNLYDLFFV